MRSLEEAGHGGKFRFLDENKNHLKGKNALTVVKGTVHIEVKMRSSFIYLLPIRSHVATLFCSNLGTAQPHPAFLQRGREKIMTEFVFLGELFL